MKLIYIFVCFTISSFSMASELPAAQLFLLSPDSSSPEAGKVDTSYRIAVSDDRPLAANSSTNSALLAQSQFEQSINARYAINDRFSILVQGLWDSTKAPAAPVIDESGDGGDAVAAPSTRSSHYGGAVELTARLFSPETLNDWDLRLSLGYRNALSISYGRTRLEATHALGDQWHLTLQGVVNHTFQPGRDTADLGFGAGMNRTIDRNWTAGLEYTGEDLESALGTGDSEGGAQHLIGPTVAWHSREEPLRFLFGPAALVQPHIETQLVARALVGWEF